MSHKLLVKDQQGEREVVLVDTVEVGRDPRCDITAADPLLSRHHAEFVASGPTVVVRDLNSRNGILVNGRRTPEAVLHPGDVVQVAQLVVTFLSHIEAETRLAPDLVPVEGRGPGPAAPAPGEEKTSLLSAVEIQAVAAASAAGRPGAGDVSGAGAGATNGTVSNGNGARRSAAWSVQLAADDDRTNLVAPRLPTSAETVAESGQPRLPATISAAAIEPLPASPLAPRVAAPPDTVHGGGRAGIAATTVALAVLCFTIGVAATMIWLRPPLTARWLLLDHVPLAVGAAFVLIVGAGGLAGVAISRSVGRVESD